MYDELVKALRNNADHYGFEAEDGLVHLLTNAADAIEELQKAVNFHKFNSEFWEDKYNSLADEKWIPVTEALPKYGTPVLAYGSRGGIFVAKYERARAEWDRDYWWKLNSAIHVCNPTHWMPLPQPPMEETT